MEGKKRDGRYFEQHFNEKWAAGTRENEGARCYFEERYNKLRLYASMTKKETSSLVFSWVRLIRRNYFHDL